MGKLIVALDNMSVAQADGMIEQLHGEVDFFKVSAQLINSQKAGEMVEEWSCYHHLRFFWDGKLYDTPQQAYNTTKELTERPGLTFFTTHCFGGGEMLRAVASALAQGNDCRSKAGQPPLLALGVTVQTNFDVASLAEIGVFGSELRNLHQDSLAYLVGDLAELAQKAGLNGVIASPWEISLVRQRCGDDFIIVVPGIRPTGYPADDQKRTSTPRLAIALGADYIVVGRPITQPKSGTPLEMAKHINDEIAAVT